MISYAQHFEKQVSPAVYALNAVHLSTYAQETWAKAPRGPQDVAPFLQWVTALATTFQKWSALPEVRTVYGPDLLANVWRVLVDLHNAVRHVAVTS